jgi:hypothetical protein
MQPSLGRNCDVALSGERSASKSRAATGANRCALAAAQFAERYELAENLGLPRLPIPIPAENYHNDLLWLAPLALPH